MTDGQHERRRYFRVSDLVGMNDRFLSDGERDLALNAQPTSLKSVLSQIEEQVTVSLLALKNSQPDIYHILDLFNQKINLAFGHGVAGNEDQGAQGTRACRVNLSACGIAFPCPEAAQLNQYMVLELTLYPSNMRLQMVAAVISCEPADSESASDDAFLIRADFVNISDADQELLVQHVIKRQAIQLKERREQAQGGESGDA